MSAISSAAAKSAPKAIPPSSTFSELLRRSKFAAYDPSIRQAYAAPPSYIHRGNWGLKRPIANRSRRGAIVLRKFEEHAQFIEWSRAEHQVKMLKAVEEMNITPTLVPQTSWFIGLGQAATGKESGFDSDFCPGESPHFERVRDVTKKTEVVKVLQKPLQDEAVWDTIMPTSSSSSMASSSSSSAAAAAAKAAKAAADLEARNLGYASLGKGGKGAYGAKAAVKAAKKEGDDSLLQPNIQSMTPVEFEKYIESLRKLRPQFLKYMREHLQKDWIASHGRKDTSSVADEDKDWSESRRGLVGVDPSTVPDEELVFLFGTEARIKYLHMAFLGRYTNENMFKEASGSLDAEHAANPTAYAEDMANRSSAIRKQPHKLGGLMYATPTVLETVLFVKPSRGLILQDAKRYETRASSEMAEYIAAFGGMTSRLQKKHAGAGVVPLYDPAAGGLLAPRVPDPSNPGKINIDSSRSEKKMRLISLQLEDTPRVVGAEVSNTPLLTTRLRTVVVVDGAVQSKVKFYNPYPPGSRDYISHEASASLAGAGQSSHLARLAQRLGRIPMAPPKMPASSIRGALPGAGVGAGKVAGQNTQMGADSRDKLLDTLSTLVGGGVASNPSRFLGFGRTGRAEVKKDEKKDS